MIYENQNKESIIIFSGKTARHLLKLGYRIRDIKPDKTNKIKSVFVFIRENNIEKEISDFTYLSDKPFMN